MKNGAKNGAYRPANEYRSDKGYRPAGEYRPTSTMPNPNQLHKPRGRRLAPLLFIAIAVVIIAALIGGALYSCTRGYVCPYDWENLVQDGDRLYYYEKGALKSSIGIDVSTFQGDVDWKQVAADGVEFVFIRIGNRGTTEGGLSIDDCFERNLNGAKQAGLAVGVYFFSQAVNNDEALEEAQFVLGILQGRYLDLPVAYDNESTKVGEHRVDGLSAEVNESAARTFCKQIEAGGYSAMIYGNARDLRRMGEAIDDYPVWLAAYSVEHPSVEHDYVIWQYSNEGDVSGIDGVVDMNIWFLTSKQSL